MIATMSANLAGLIVALTLIAILGYPDWKRLQNKRSKPARPDGLGFFIACVVLLSCGSLFFINSGGTTGVIVGCVLCVLALVFLLVTILIWREDKRIRKAFADAHSASDSDS